MEFNECKRIERLADTHYNYDGIVTAIVVDTPSKFAFKLKDDNYQEDIQFILTRNEKHSELSGLFEIGERVKISTKSKVEAGTITIEGVKYDRVFS